MSSILGHLSSSLMAGRVDVRSTSFGILCRTLALVSGQLVLRQPQCSTIGLLVLVTSARGL